MCCQRTHAFTHTLHIQSFFHPSGLSVMLAGTTAPNVRRCGALLTSQVQEILGGSSSMARAVFGEHNLPPLSLLGIACMGYELCGDSGYVSPHVPAGLIRAHASFFAYSAPSTAHVPSARAAFPFAHVHAVSWLCEQGAGAGVAHSLEGPA
jgi:hypothetical protein